MSIAAKEKLRVTIGHRARQLRQERRWTQASLAKLLGLSQNRLSEVEHGKGSFTAEQLLTILKIFNVQIDYFVPQKEHASELQNALARLGAIHLAQSTDVLPTERLKGALAAIRETLASGEPRQIAALAPVLVNHAEGLNFAKLYADLQQVGLTGRLGWAVENTLQALAAELAARKQPPLWMIRYKRVHTALDQLLSHFFESPARGAGPAQRIVEDILDPGIASMETLQQIKKERSEISRGWHIVTRIQPEDFRQALEAARGTD